MVSEEQKMDSGSTAPGRELNKHKQTTEQCEPNRPDGERVNKINTPDISVTCDPWTSHPKGDIRQIPPLSKAEGARVPDH